VPRFDAYFWLAEVGGQWQGVSESALSDKRGRVSLARNRYSPKRLSEPRLIGMHAPEDRSGKEAMLPNRAIEPSLACGRSGDPLCFHDRWVVRGLER
jgi:hypothetical protein